MAARRIRREGARGNMGEYGNVWDGMGEDTVVDGATAKENLAVGVDGNTGSTGNTATGADGLRFMADNKTGEAVRFLHDGDKEILIAEGFEFDKTKNMQEAMQDYILLLNGKSVTIKEDKTDVFFDKNSATEYARSNDTKKLRNRHSKLFKAKAKAVAAVGSIVENARSGRDENVKAGHSKEKQNGIYRRYDVEFGLPSGINEIKVYTGELLVWVPEKKNSTFYDITNIKLNRKVRDTANAADSTGPRYENEANPHQPPANTNTIPQNSENANNFRFSVSGDGTDFNGNVRNITDNPNFKRWFADSKVVDDNGEPLVVYHGTLAKELHAFNKDFIGSRYSYDDRGFFFIDRKSIAEDYAVSDFDSSRKGQVIAAYVSLQKPLVIDKKWGLKNGLGDVFRDNDVIDFWDAYQSYVWDMVDEANADGVIIKDGSSTMVVALEPTQIKSAADNVGTFDRSNPDIRFLLAEFSEADRRDITLILKPFVGFALDHEDRIYKEYLAKKGIAVSEKDAHAFAVFAMQENKLDRNKRTAQRREKARQENIRRRDQYLYDNFPFYREAVEFAGSHDFKIKPSGKFRGEEFSGYSSLAIFTFFSILKLIHAIKSAATPIMYGRSFFRKSAAV